MSKFMKLRTYLITGSTLLVLLSSANAQNKTSIGDANRGEKQSAICAGCHGSYGYKATFPEVYRVPKIAGQNASALANALEAYKTGQRKHPSMRGIAESLTKQDIDDLSAYYERIGQ
jgi:cytochrome c553